MQQQQEREAQLLTLFRTATVQQQKITLGMLQYCLAPQDKPEVHVIVAYSDPESGPN